MITVVAALIGRNGKVLICQRKPEQRHPLKWEFPGGKVERGETPTEALERELEEELGIRARTGPEVTRYEYTYEGRDPILLVFYLVSEFSGELQNLVFEQIRWEEAAGLPFYDFVEGDVDFVRRLAAGGFNP